MNSFAERLTADERERRWANQRPRDAATLIILDRAGKEPKVLMGKRHEKHKFMPGKFVFPGGRLDPADRRMVAAGALMGEVEDKLSRRVLRESLSRPRALALAAIRETFEETGLLIGTREHGAPESAPAGIWRDFAAQSIFPTLENLHFIARAITPPKRPKRFDARFFAVDAREIAGEVGGIIGPEAELTELVWTPLSKARALDLPTITLIVLEELDNRIAAGFSPRLPVPFYYERHRKWHREEL